MRFTILVPHYKAGKITAHCLSKIHKYKGKHDIRVIVIDNNPGDGSIAYLRPFPHDLISYPKDKLQSHGIAFDYAMDHVDTEWFITPESDSFPTHEGWLDYYERLIKEGYDGGGSLLKLSGGTYVHPCGALYKTADWKAAKRYCDDEQPYIYFPNMAMREGFACHTMIRTDKVEKIISSMDDYFDVAEDYKGKTREQIMDRANHYFPCTQPFHNGMGHLNESIKSYGDRDMNLGPIDVMLKKNMQLVYRIGYEPGQWLSYWLKATGRKIFYVPTQIQWMPGREMQQQAFTSMENGFTHIWGVSSYYDKFKTQDETEEFGDVITEKRNFMNRLYAELPIEEQI
ncbi:MAG: hypothetical protein C5B59_07985 [Bacteroidetes bacterium]|nr:MAG: hypothetical protein C5B59_07985 [Bacteroidota bacterium]